MNRIDLIRPLLVTTSAVALGACSGGSSDPANNGLTGMNDSNESASLSVSLMDAPVDDVTEVNLVITGLFLKPEEGEAQELPLMETPFETDLLSLTDIDPALLVDGALIEAGAYEWLRMEVDAVIDSSTEDSHVITDLNEEKELFVPSGRVQLVGGFEVGTGESVELLFDWNLRSGLVHPPGLGGRDRSVYLLKPTIRVIGTTVADTLSGTVLMTTVMDELNECNTDNEIMDYDLGNVVYIFEGHDVVPDDNDELDDVTPYATVEALLNEESTDYEYSTLLPAGLYTVAFTCQGGNDDAEFNETGNEDPMLDTVSFLPAVNIEIGGDAEEPGVVVNF